MTAVLSATDALRRDRIMSLDDNQINYSPGNSNTDWKEKYYEAADMLAETRAELDDFQHSSKELEEELERELERTERAQHDLKIKVAKAEAEREEWKSKFMSLQTTHNTTTTSLQRELDTLRQTHQQLKSQMCELEMGNDDLERNERAVSSSLADAEAKYSRVLEEKILLEHELLDKASLEEQSQRLKDELRDATLEITVLKDQLAQALSTASTVQSASTSGPSSVMPRGALADDTILKMKPPSELLLSELTTGSTSTSASESSSVSSSPPTTLESTPSQVPRKAPNVGQSTLLKRAGFSSRIASPSSSPGAVTVMRSSTLPSFSPSRMPPPRTPAPSRQPLSQRNDNEHSVASTSSLATAQFGTASKSKGVQMVSEMRARVRNLEQKLHTRVPRLRMTSITSRNKDVPPPAVFGFSTNTPENQSRIKRQSIDLEKERKKVTSGVDKQTPTADTSGWVLIMEDSSTSPTPTKEKERRRSTSPSRIPFRPAASTNPSGIAGAAASGVRRPQSRLSVSTDGRNSVCTTATTSSIPTPTSRPATPTFLPVPVPTSNLYGISNQTVKRSTAPVPKRASLGSNSSSPSSFLSPQETQPRQRPPSVTASRPASSASKVSPHPSSNVTVRASNRLSASTAAQNIFAQSRIGRPNSLGMGRKSAGGESDDSGSDGRARAGSTAALGGRLT